MPSNPGIIVLGGHVQGLGILRILGKFGIPGILIDNTSINIARHSSFCSKFIKVSDKDILHLLFEIGSRETRYRNWVIFPTNDFYLMTISQNKERLEEYFIVASDTWLKVKEFYNKINTYKLAEKIGVPFPKSYFPQDLPSLSSIDIQYPCLLKPAVVFNFYKKTKKKALICRNRKELLLNYKRAVKLIPSDEIIIQEIIPGNSNNQYSACFLFLRGKVVTYLTACRLRQHPIDFGNASTYVEVISVPKIKEYGELILEASGYDGLCEVEFKLDERDNTFKLLEVNARTWKWHAIAEHSNTPFLKSYYDYLSGCDIQQTLGFSEASFRHALTDFPTQLMLMFRGERGWNRVRYPYVRAVWDLNDIKPWLMEKVYLPFLMKNR